MIIIIESLINAKGSDRPKVHESLHEYFVTDRDDSENSDRPTPNDEWNTDVAELD
jgi:hypothetical protein